MCGCLMVDSYNYVPKKQWKSKRKFVIDALKFLVNNILIYRANYFLKLYLIHFLKMAILLFIKHFDLWTRDYKCLIQEITGKIKSF